MDLKLSWLVLTESEIRNFKSRITTSDGLDSFVNWTEHPVSTGSKIQDCSTLTGIMAKRSSMYLLNTRLEAIKWER